jgi:GAF domain-containing protein
VRVERGKPHLETVGLEAGYGDVLEAVAAASIALGRHQSLPEVADAALDLALQLTRSSVAFLALVDEDGGDRNVFSRAADPSDGRSPDDIEKLFVPGGAGLPGNRSTASHSLEVAGQLIGTIGVASSTGYTAVQQRAFALLATQVAMALGLAQQNDRRKKMVDTLVNLRADLDRSERQRLVNEERARSAERVEHAH